MRTKIISCKTLAEYIGYIIIREHIFETARKAYVLTDAHELI